MDNHNSALIERAREIAAKDMPDVAFYILSGDLDQTAGVRCALAALRDTAASPTDEERRKVEPRPEPCSVCGWCREFSKVSGSSFERCVECKAVRPTPDVSCAQAKAGCPSSEHPAVAVQKSQTGRNMMSVAMPPVLLPEQGVTANADVRRDALEEAAKVAFDLAHKFKEDGSFMLFRGARDAASAIRSLALDTDGGEKS